MEHANRGETALNANKYDEAIGHYTKAIKETPTSPNYYIKRSIAYQRASKITDALHDAEYAVILANKRAKRELIAQAQLRRGIALYHLEKYGDAEFVFAVAKRLDQKDKSFGMWADKVKLKIKGLAESEASKKDVTVKEMPDVQEPGVEPELSNTKETLGTTTTMTPAENQNEPSSAPSTSEPSKGAQTPATKIRHEWYQNNENVYITLLAKGVPKDQASIDIEKGSITVSFPLATGSSYDFSLEPLFAEIDATSSSFKVFPTKIEITLKKANPGHKWSALEGTFPVTAPSQPSAAEPDVAKTVAATTTTTTPSYPTSSRTGPKNWDKIVDSYSKPAGKASGKSNGHDHKEEDKQDLIDDDDEGDDVNRFFKQLYKGANDDTRKAMMKSFQESGGTALSTNWDEVKKAPVPIQPPDGMEARKWDS